MALMKEALQQSVYIQAFSRLEPELRASLQPGDYAQLQKNQMRLIASNLRNAHLHGEVHELLTGQNIPYTILKGLASAAYYPEPFLRTMGDVDFLVPYSQRQTVDCLLREKGFEKAPNMEKHAFHWAYHRGEDVVELHWRIPGLPESGAGQISALFSDILPCAEETELSGYRIRVPSWRHHGIILLLHTAEHLTAGGAGIRHLWDWLAFVYSRTEETFRAELENVLRQTGLWRFACALTKIGVVYMDCEPRAFCEEIDRALAERLLEDFFDGGSFGNKNNVRQGQTKIVRDNASRKSGERPMLLAALGNLDKKTRSQYPVCERWALLRPFFWLWTAFQFLLRVAQGKRVNIFQKDALRSARDRQTLYASLGLFEPDLNGNAGRRRR